MPSPRHRSATRRLSPEFGGALFLHRFPYAVLYRIVADEVQVVAVMHTRRPPGIGDDRRAIPRASCPGHQVHAESGQRGVCYLVIRVMDLVSG
jgi:hypothetical protein